MAEFRTMKLRNAQKLMRDCSYDIDAARAKVLSLRSAGNDRHRLARSYAAALGQGLRGSGTGNEGNRRSGGSVAREQSRPTLQFKLEEDHPESAVRDYNETGCVLSGRRREINQHFLEVFMAKNTSYRALLSPCGREVLFDGPVSNGRNRPDLREIKMDLHGLSVMHALQIVGSCLDWLLRALSPHSATACDFVLTKSREIELRFVVGLGLHSHGGKRKLAPAVRRFLEERGLVCKSQPGDAVITCCFCI